MLPAACLWVASTQGIYFAMKAVIHIITGAVYQNSLLSGYNPTSLNYTAYCSGTSEVSNQNGFLQCADWAPSFPGGLLISPNFIPAQQI